MDKMFRFSDYDIFAYVVSGFATLLVIDFTVATHLVLGANWTVSEGLIVVVAAYVAGQIIAAPASLLFERGLVRKALGRPIDWLMKLRQPEGLRRTLSRTILAEYFAPLDRCTRERLSNTMKSEGIDSGEELFWRAFPTVKNDETGYARLESFQKLYGFCRNIAFVAFCGGIALFFKALGSLGLPDGAAFREFGGSAAAFVIGAGMVLRYLKFRRLYVVEVLTTFCALCSRADEPGSLKPSTQTSAPRRRKPVGRPVAP